MLCWKLVLCIQNCGPNISPGNQVPVSFSFHCSFQLQFTCSVVLHSCQVYSIVVKQSYTLQHGSPPNISSVHLAPSTFSDSAPCTALYIPRPTYFVTANLYFLIPSPFPPSSPSPPPFWHSSVISPHNTPFYLHLFSSSKPFPGRGGPVWVSRSPSLVLCLSGPS